MKKAPSSPPLFRVYQPSDRVPVNCIDAAGIVQREGRVTRVHQVDGGVQYTIYLDNGFFIKRFHRDIPGSYDFLDRAAREELEVYQRNFQCLGWGLNDSVGLTNLNEVLRYLSECRALLASWLYDQKKAS